jgi:hypothetical protein
MDVDIVAIGAFVAIASVIWLSLWTSYRDAEDKRQRLERFRRHW